MFINREARLFRCTASAALDVAGQTNASQFALCCGFLLALRKTVPPGYFQCLLHMLFKLTRIVFEIKGSGVGHGIGGNEIASPQLIRSKPDFLRGEIYKTLNGIDGLRTTGPAIGVHRCSVGKYPMHLHISGGNSIATHQHRDPCGSRHEWGEVRQVGAEVGDGVYLQSQHLAVIAHGQFEFADVVTTVAVSGKGFAALGDPLYGTLEFAGCIKQRNIFREQEYLHAKAAAYIVAFHQDLFRRAVEYGLRQQAPQQMDALTRHMQNQSTRFGLHVCDGAASLHGTGYYPVVD